MVALIAAVPAAAATTVYRGKTSQDRRVKVVMVDGEFDYIFLRWLADCRRAGENYYRGATRWLNRPEGPIERDGDAFSDSGRVRIRYRRFRFVERLSLSGSFRPEGRIAGVHRARVRVYRRGKRIDTCTARVRWRAKLG